MGLSTGYICGYTIITSKLLFDINKLLDLDLFDDKEIDELINNPEDLRDEILESNASMLGLKFHYMEGKHNVLELPMRTILENRHFIDCSIGNIRHAVDAYLKEKGIDNPEDFEFESYSYFR